ncbi:hypothetical protein FRC03_005449 [Tulasnella sp. 419]|nr:hypothetical protein FRC03_005449 [Tulasnella sp. 419]
MAISKAEGKFNHIGISETAAKTLERAVAVSPIAAVEIEISPWAYEEETKKVIGTEDRLGVTTIEYTPLGRGFLSGKLQLEDLPQGDIRRRYAKYQEEALKHNQKLADALTAIVEKKGISTA